MKRPAEPIGLIKERLIPTTIRVVSSKYSIDTSRI